MTTLDAFLDYLPEEVQILAGHQQTPNMLFLSFSEQDFFKILNHSIADMFVFRFLEEKTPPNVLIHLFFNTNNRNIQVTFNVNNRTAEFNQQITEIFPSAAIYLENMD